MARWASVAVILSTNGSRLDLATIATIPRAQVVCAEFARGDHAACVAATLEHDCDPAELAAAARRWARARGWSVTVAPLRGAD